MDIERTASWSLKRLAWAYGCSRKGSDEETVFRRALLAMTRWTLLGRPAPGGHRFFSASDGRIAVADNSGYYPDTTQDGPLWLDPSRPIRIDGSVVDLPVTTDDGQSQWVLITRRDEDWLVKDKHWTGRVLVRSTGAR